MLGFFLLANFAHPDKIPAIWYIMIYIHIMYIIQINILSMMQYVTLFIAPKSQKHSTSITEKVKTLYTFHICTIIINFLLL